MVEAPPPVEVPRVSRTMSLIATLAGFIGNVIPLYGVLALGWETFPLLNLYWLETVIVAFWTLMRLARLTGDERGTMTVNGQVQPASRAGLVGFFAGHAGLFILVHLLFLWLMFSSEWLKKVHGVASFFSELLLANGYWVALVFMFIAGWISYLANAKPAYAHHVERKVRGLVASAPAKADGEAVGSIVGALYTRIVIMQVAIIFGAWFSGFSSSMAPMLLVIALKTVIDLGFGPHVPVFKHMTMSSGKTSIEV